MTLTPTPTATVTPSPTASDTPFPTNTPLPRLDHWESIVIPDNIRDGLDHPYIVFINQNNSATLGNLATAEPSTNTETLYFASPIDRADRTPILELPESTTTQVYLAPLGNAIAYFVTDPLQEATGLYVLYVADGLSGRVLPVDSLTQRGIFSAPTWSPDGAQLAAVIETAYDLDIYVFDLGTSAWQPLIQHPAFDFWPAWSPDGRYLAFVSDRMICPSWTPGEVGACDPAANPLPNGGHVYVLDTNSGAITQLSDVWTMESPYWINNERLAFSGGNPLDLLHPSRSLWVASLPEMTAREVRLNDGGATQLNVAETWSADGRQVIFQSANATTTEIVVVSADGARLATIDALSFARFAMAAAWSPDGARLAIGGRGGLCPYGVRVLDENFALVATGVNPRSMCEPIFSPNGRSIAFSGFNTNAADGRVDIYCSSADGFDAQNLTADLRGQMILVGWVGP